MFRIRRVYDDLLRADREAIRQVQDILRVQIPQLSEEDIVKLPDQLRNPLKHKFRSVLFVAEDSKRRVDDRLPPVADPGGPGRRLPYKVPGDQRPPLFHGALVPDLSCGPVLIPMDICGEGKTYGPGTINLGGKYLLAESEPHPKCVSGCPQKTYV